MPRKYRFYKRWYDYPQPPIKGLNHELRFASDNLIPFAYLCYLDTWGVKWKIRPANFQENGKPSSLHLYHRNTLGEAGFHHQGKVLIASPKAVLEFARYIESHEEYERTIPTTLTSVTLGFLRDADCTRLQQLYAEDE